MIAEIIIYLIAAIASLFITSYVVHMFVGGIVSPETEFQLTVIACLVVALIIAYMVWDVVQRRRQGR